MPSPALKPSLPSWIASVFLSFCSLHGIRELTAVERSTGNLLGRRSKLRQVERGRKVNRIQDCAKRFPATLHQEVSLKWNCGELRSVFNFRCTIERLVGTSVLPDE